QSRRPMPRWPSAVEVRSEAIGEYLERAASLLTAQRLEHDVVPLLRFRESVPGTVERDERPVLVSRREQRTRVEHETVRCPVRGEDGAWLVFPRAVSALLPVAAIFRREHEVVLVDRVVAVRPAEILALIHLQQLFRRILGVVMDALRPLTGAFRFAAEPVAT